MKINKYWKILMGTVLVLLSAGFYFIHYLLFHNAHHIFVYLIGGITVGKIDLNKLADILIEKRKFLLNLLQNPNLLEHESFSETLMSIFHITEELAARDLDNLSREDMNHTKTDLERAYRFLTLQWLAYMDYTQKNFPYFYLYAVQTNPFDRESAWFKTRYGLAAV